MAMAMAINNSYIANDRRYNEVCANLAHARLAVGGDSHARRMAVAMEQLIGRGNFEGGITLNRPFNFTQGGMQLMNYFNDGNYNSLKRCSADVVLLFLGGNDLDMIRPRERRDVLHDFLMLFIELESLGKVVYIVGIPNRWSRRHQNLHDMQANISYINQRLKYIIKGRFIALPTFTYRADSFERVFRHVGPPGPPIREERVHLLEENYPVVAQHVLQKVDRNLRSRWTEPNKIERTINLFFDGH